MQFSGIVSGCLFVLDTCVAIAINLGYTTQWVDNLLDRAHQVGRMLHALATKA